MFDGSLPEIADLASLTDAELVDAAGGWSRAENAAAAIRGQDGAALQFGRGGEAAENADAERDPAIAGMLQFGRGGEAAENPIPKCSSLAPLLRLQFGRGGEAAENDDCQRSECGGDELQFGRGGEAAENRPGPSRCPRVAGRFNSAAAVRPRRTRP